MFYDRVESSIKILFLKNIFQKIFYITISGPWYVYPIEPCQIVETNSTTDLDKDEALRANFTIRYRQDCGLPFGFLYGLEIASVVTTTVLGILVNSLLGKYLYTCHSSEINGFWST